MQNSAWVSEVNIQVVEAGFGSAAKTDKIMGYS